MLHFVIVGIIASSLLSYVAIPAAEPGRASAVEEVVPVFRADLSQVRASLNAAARAPELAAFIPPSDNLMLAVVSLEAAEDPGQVTESIERIQNLAVPQEIPEEVPEPGIDCVESSSPAFCVYTVVQGDTLSAIAAELGFSGNEFLSDAEMLAQSNKPDVTSSDHIEPGQNLRIPYETGIVHTVLGAESLASVAESYGVTVEDIVSSPYNPISSNDVLRIGDSLLIPNPVQLPVSLSPTLNITPEPTPTQTAEPTPTPEPTHTPEPTATPEPTVDAAAQAEATTPEAEETATEEPEEPTEEPDTPTPEPEDEADEDEQEPADDEEEPENQGYFFIWPATGPISSYFGPSHPLGIDIDLFHDPNADIRAARAGDVIFAGGDPCCSYGYYVIVDHGNGLQTVYAHLSSIRVDVGEYVGQGELLGQAGRTGYATGNHLHFEIRVDGHVVDPLLYLP